MKKPIMLALSITIALGIVNTQADVLYLVDDQGLNDSQFLKKDANSIVSLGTTHEDCDIEALDIHEESKALYAAAGDDTPRAGHLYQVDKNHGYLFDLGVIGGEIDGISFHPRTGDLWGWMQCKGLFIVHASDIPSHGVEIPGRCERTPAVPSISSELIFEREAEIEDIKWNKEGTILYAVENIHPAISSSCMLQGGEPDSGDEDPHEGVKLWAYDATIGTVQALCSKELADIPEIEGLEILPKETFGDGNQDVLAVGFHNAHQLEYLLISPPYPPVTECEILWKGSIPLVADVEGMAYDSPLEDPSTDPIDPCAPYQMTGGGSVKLEGDIKVNYGFELHCDADDVPNNIEINWSGRANKFKLNELTTPPKCSDDPNLDEYPPEAGFDTYEGEGKGELNGKEATIKFKFTDAGEPGKNDQISVEIVQQGQTVLIIQNKVLDNGGNHQSHGLGNECEGDPGNT